MKEMISLIRKTICLPARVLFLGILLLLFYALALSVPVEAEGKIAEPYVVVSLGDSYSSGEGVEPFYNLDDYPFYEADLSISEKVNSKSWVAHRSMNSWPGMLTASWLGGEPLYKLKDECWFFEAISGAKTGDITGNDIDWDNTALKKEWSYFTTKSRIVGNGLSIVSGTTQLEYQINIFKDGRIPQGSVRYVTVTIGGNDVQFVSVLKKVIMGTSYLHFNSVSSLLSELYAEMPNTLMKLENTYKAISEAAGPQATILVAGYPCLLEPHIDIASLVSPLFAIEPIEAEYVNNAVRDFNNYIEQLIIKLKKEGMNIEFVDVDVEEGFKGHEAYSSDPYLNPLMLIQKEDINQTSPISDYSFHPNYKTSQSGRHDNKDYGGIGAYARCVQAKIDELEEQKKTPPVTGRDTIVDDRNTLARDLLEGGKRLETQAMEEAKENWKSQTSFSFEDLILNGFYSPDMYLDYEKWALLDVFGIRNEFPTEMWGLFFPEQRLNMALLKEAESKYEEAAKLWDSEEIQKALLNNRVLQKWDRPDQILFSSQSGVNPWYCSYDSLGRMIRMQNDSGTIETEYDAAAGTERLRVYSYDEEQIVEIYSRTLTRDEVNRPISFSKKYYGHDDILEGLTDATWTWDEAGRLQTTTFQSEVEGDVGQVTFYYLWDDNTIASIELKGTLNGLIVSEITFIPEIRTVGVGYQSYLYFICEGLDNEEVDTSSCALIGSNHNTLNLISMAMLGMGNESEFEQGARAIVRAGWKGSVLLATYEAVSESYEYDETGYVSCIERIGTNEESFFSDKENLVLNSPLLNRKEDCDYVRTQYNELGRPLNQEWNRVEINYRYRTDGLLTSIIMKEESRETNEILYVYDSIEENKETEQTMPVSDNTSPNAGFVNALPEADEYWLTSVEDTEDGWFCHIDAYKYYTVSQEVIDQMKRGDIYSLPGIGDCVVQTDGFDEDNMCVILLHEVSSQQYAIFEIPGVWVIGFYASGDRPFGYNVGNAVVFVPYDAVLLDGELEAEDMDPHVNSPYELLDYYYDEKGELRNTIAVVVISLDGNTVTRMEAQFYP